jgi:8-oxo-dGTP pyrophosphatase MutT (NUDIX family)
LTEMKRQVIEKAGVVPFTPGGNVLICTSLSNPTHWVLPKGHCDEIEGQPGVFETHLVTAVRECEEEIGWKVELFSEEIVGEIETFLYFEDEAKTISVYERVLFYAGEITSRTGEGDRPVLQIDPLSALLQLSHREGKQTLLNAIVLRAGGKFATND